ncbi:hypothetical protein DUI87_29015 [Hirundo rustica rustica]|uniref:Uncharacterized protein n=1 Tax=Hirundo rustica rustica TaxID=333673 RepID=A0A3M0J622_HIRRU|nr:hypothetical protein DUI87_29015 [Hirundo rustica rustica]
MTTAFDQYHKDLNTGDDAKMAVETPRVLRIHGMLFPGLAPSLRSKQYFHNWDLLQEKIQQTFPQLGSAAGEIQQTFPQLGSAAAEDPTNISTTGICCCRRSNKHFHNWDLLLQKIQQTFPQLGSAAGEDPTNISTTGICRRRSTNISTTGICRRRSNKHFQNWDLLQEKIQNNNICRRRSTTFPQLGSAAAEDPTNISRTDLLQRRSKHFHNGEGEGLSTTGICCRRSNKRFHNWDLLQEKIQITFPELGSTAGEAKSHFHSWDLLQEKPRAASDFSKPTVHTE